MPLACCIAYDEWLGAPEWSEVSINEPGMDVNLRKMPARACATSLCEGVWGGAAAVRRAKKGEGSGPQAPNPRSEGMLPGAARSYGVQQSRSTAESGDVRRIRTCPRSPPSGSAKLPFGSGSSSTASTLIGAVVGSPASLSAV